MTLPCSRPAEPYQEVASFRVEPPRLAETVVVYGFPLSGMLSSSGNVTLGNISALMGLGDDSRDVQISAAVQPGNSGGPMFDGSGLLLGVVQSKLNAIRAASVTGDIAQNVNFAIRGSLWTVLHTLAWHQGICSFVVCLELMVADADIPPTPTRAC